VSANLVLLVAYKTVGLLIGLVVIYLGYRLFTAGVRGSADLHASHTGAHGEYQLRLLKGAPGLFFALFGVVIVVVVLLSRVEVNLGLDGLGRSVKWLFLH
jgi:uncharacterized membrane protein